MGLRLFTGPTGDVVTLEEAKQWARITHNASDGILPGMIAQAVTDAELICLRQFLTATWELVLDGFYDAQELEREIWGPPRQRGEILIPLPPVQSLTWIKYYDTAGDLQTVDAADYHADLGDEPARVWPVDGVTWPETEAGRPAAVTLRFVAGYGLAAAVPEAAKTWIKCRAAWLHEHRGDDPAEWPERLDRFLDKLQWGGRFG